MYSLKNRKIRLLIETVFPLNFQLFCQHPRFQFLAVCFLLYSNCTFELPFWSHTRTWATLNWYKGTARIKTSWLIEIIWNVQSGMIDGSSSSFVTRLQNLMLSFCFWNNVILLHYIWCQWKMAFLEHWQMVLCSILLHSTIGKDCVQHPGAERGFGQWKAVAISYIMCI